MECRCMQRLHLPPSLPPQPAFSVLPAPPPSPPATPELLSLQQQPAAALAEGPQGGQRHGLRVAQAVPGAVHPAAAPHQASHQRADLLRADGRPELAAPRGAGPAPRGVGWEGEGGCVEWAST